MRQVNDHKSLAGASPSFLEVLRNAEMVAFTDVPILISGEPGSGKFSLAKHVHDCSRRQRQRFVAFDCRATEAETIDDVLFGNGETPGKLREIRSGTLFLNRIHAMPARTQAKLVNFLSERDQPDSNDSSSKRSPARIIAATEFDLRDLVNAGKFDSALYHQLNVIHLEMPPLRERDGDVPLLINHFFQQLVQQYRRPAPSVTSQAMRLLTAYRWPGNLRELKNICERLFLINNGSEISPKNLPVEIRCPSIPSNPVGFRLPDTGIDLAALESELLHQALDHSRGNKSHAARLLGLSRDAFLYRLKKYSVAR